MRIIYNFEIVNAVNGRIFIISYVNSSGHAVVKATDSEGYWESIYDETSASASDTVNELSFLSFNNKQYIAYNTVFSATPRIVGEIN